MRRMARFFVADSILFYDESIARAIFRGLVILEARHAYDRGGMDYLATGDQFDDVAEGEEAPRYLVSVETGTVEWKREQ